MGKFLLLSSIFFLILYYILTFLISFTLLSKSVVINDHISLAKYIIIKDLRSNFYGDIDEFSSSIINSMDKKIKIKSESIEFTGELSPMFLKKLFSKMANNISKDFSNPKIMLYFYFNSNEISKYLNKSFTNFGDYTFKKYFLEKQLVNGAETEIKKTKTKEIKEIKKEEMKNIISKLIQRIKSVDYFFLISPIHFKIEVKHQDILFIIILKFNGYIWKVQKIIIPYDELIDSKNISIIN